jgi:hypothetical protein
MRFDETVARDETKAQPHNSACARWSNEGKTTPRAKPRLEAETLRARLQGRIE